MALQSGTPNDVASGETVGASPASLTEHIASLIRTRIRTGLLLPGARIRPSALADEAGVSTMPVRESLVTLAQEGLIEHIPRRGFRVAAVSLDHLSNLTELRDLLESRACQRAVAEVDGRHLEIVEEAMERLKQASQDDYYSRNRDFHFEIFGLCGNPALVSAIARSWEQMARYHGLYIHETSDFEALAREHEEMVDALKQRNEPRLVTIQRAHRDRLFDVLKNWLTHSGSGNKDEGA